MAVNKKWTRRAAIKSALNGAIGGVGLTLTSPIWAEKRSADVVVIGAGLAGLHAATLLEQAGLDVIVLESSTRAGGRVFTLDHLDGRPEIGANQVGIDYSVLRSIAQRHGIGFGDSAAMLPGMALHINGQLLDAKAWKNHSSNTLVAQEKALQPSSLLWSFLHKGETLKSADDWLKPTYAHLDIPLHDHLKSLGASTEALRLMNCNFIGEDIQRVSALQMLRKYVILQNNKGSQFIAGGTQRIPDAMRAALKSPLLFEKRVVRIENNAAKVNIRCQDGSDYSAQRVVMAIPFSTARDIDLRSPISSLKREAIKDLGYNSITHVLLRPTHKFWEDDGLSANMWTDTPLGMVFAQMGKENGVLRVRAWLMGLEAQQLDAVSEAQIGKEVIKTFARLRPASQGKLALETVFSWKRYVHSRGAVAFFKAGDISRFAAAVSKPEGRLHFAGEHTDFRKSGMEAAVLSAERCAAEIKTALKA